MSKLKRQSYAKNALAVFDESGYLPLSRVDANLFFQLVSTRYENGPTILTSNKSYVEWSDFFPDERIASAILDRLLHYSRMTMTIHISGLGDARKPVADSDLSGHS